MSVNGYDIIGDIHGHADALEALLVKMDYRFIGGCYRHLDRVVIFWGILLIEAQSNVGSSIQ